MRRWIKHAFRLAGYDIARRDAHDHPEFSADMSLFERDVFTAVKPFTMTSVERVTTLVRAVQHVVAQRLTGDVVECGVWRGGSAMAIALTLVAARDTSRGLYLFDTFSGMTPPSAKDVTADGRDGAALLAQGDDNSWVVARASLDEVKRNLATTGYPMERIHFIQGAVEDTIPGSAPAAISLLRLDTDWYESTKHELDTLYSRLAPGGVLMIDDYGWWQGSRTATDEFLAESGAQLLLMRMGSGRIAVKPR